MIYQRRTRSVEFPCVYLSFFLIFINAFGVLIIAVTCLCINLVVISLKICRLGKHTPIVKLARDGILRVSKATAQKETTKPPADEWFKLLGETQLSALLRLYAQVCNHRLAPHLTQVIQERSLLDQGDNQASNKQQPQAAVPTAETMPATPDSTTGKPESVGESRQLFAKLQLIISISYQMKIES